MYFVYYVFFIQKTKSLIYQKAHLILFQFLYFNIRK